MTRRIPILALALIVVVSLDARADPGELDPTFGVSGIAVSPVEDLGWCGGCPPPGAIAIQSLRRIVTTSASVGGNIVRFTPDGNVDPTFGTAGVAAPPALPRPFGWTYIRALATQANDAIVIAGDALDDFGGAMLVARYTPHGVLDTAFGSDGVAILRPDAGAYYFPAAIRILADGKMLVVGGTQGVVRPSRASPMLARFTATGVLDTSFATGGYVIHASPDKVFDTPADVAVQQDGRILTVGGVGPNLGPTSFSLWRYTPEGAIDTTFADGGHRQTNFSELLAGTASASASAIQLRNGKLIVAGIVRESFPAQPDFARLHIALARYSSDGTLDPTFGVNGKVVRPLTGYFLHMMSSKASLVVQPDGRMIVGAGTLREGGDPQDPDAYGLVLTRFEPDGALDPTYGHGGSMTLPGTGQSSALVLQDDGKPLAVGSLRKLALARFTPDTNALAVEYRHAAFEHYFFTASVDEIARLDDGRTPGWTRTGLAFRVFPLGTNLEVCRFFSGAKFAPLSSHFYTANAGECDAVRSNPDWIYEGKVFSFGDSPDGTCPAETDRLYRFYNGGRGGAPNHRFVTDEAARVAMLVAGWIPEGTGPGVAGCVPRVAN